ncbi:hypothetical protein Tco_0168802 [Tanacetum coccineum]
MPSNQRSGSSTKVEESSSGDENGQKNDTSLEELHNLAGGTDIKHNTCRVCPEELKGIHSTFHVSNLKKCLAEGDVVVLMEESQLDDKFHMIEEPVEIVDKEVKRLKQSRTPIVKVYWNSQRGPEFTWEREDQIKKKHPHLFTSKDKAERVDETS